MSAFFSRIEADRIELLTDAGAWDDAGILTKIQRKVWTCEAFPMAIAGRGKRTPILAARLIEAADTCNSLDEFLVELRRWIKLASLRSDGIGHEEILVAGWDGVAFSQHWFTTKVYPGTEADLTAFELFDMGRECRGSIEPTGQDLARAGITNAMLSAPNFASRHGADLFECCRAKGERFHHDIGASFVPIGGHVDLTVITKAGATTQILRQWPDKIGEKIVSLKGNVDALHGMNRAARRAARKRG